MGDYEFFRKEFHRLLTFTGWPLSSPVDRYDLAAAGFYRISLCTVKCFACFGRISDWHPGDKPFYEHKRFFPSCPFVCHLETRNVPLTSLEKQAALQDSLGSI